jgi:hypothetical protein
MSNIIKLVAYPFLFTFQSIIPFVYILLSADSSLILLRAEAD